jgi:uncharacterized Zn finger protein
MLEKFECTQCGSHEYEEPEEGKIKCGYCGTVYKVKEEPVKQPKVIIGKGANVIFGEKSNVTIKGGVKIEQGANVQFLGKLEIFELGDEEKIKNSEYYQKKQGK